MNCPITKYPGGFEEVPTANADAIDWIVNLGVRLWPIPNLSGKRTHFVTNFYFILFYRLIFYLITIFTVTFYLNISLSFSSLSLLVLVFIIWCYIMYLLFMPEPYAKKKSEFLYDFTSILNFNTLFEEIGQSKLYFLILKLCSESLIKKKKNYHFFKVQ